ncbi:hypothetical protein CJ030_MR4G003868 [Morella rubra]|uniref:Pentacotripeptide-repeat region of PRORP domain-containing protein n=1 Tax=Morella rubra TaxID=262757 RepID=A0A6A1VUV7_9ROSI|nr:hypothetical protein CJ030_MR4G003868 [Morella rubra]
MWKLFLRRTTLICLKNRPSTISGTLSSSPSFSYSSLLPPSPSDLTNAILSSRTPAQALGCFNDASKRINPAENPQPFAAVIHVLTRTKLYTKARCLIKDLIQKLQISRKPQRVCHFVFSALDRLESSKFTHNVFGVLILALIEMGLVEEALWVHKKMGVLLAVQACNGLLYGLLKIGRFGSMWELYGDMVSRGLSPNVVTYGVLINGCSSQGDISKARKLFDEMVGKGIEATVVVYTSLICGLCRESEMDEAERVLKLMRESGVLPNLYTYNIIMDGYCKMANVKRSLNLYQNVLDDNLWPNVVTFGILIDSLCKLGELMTARNFFVHMAKFGVVPNIFVYNCLIDGHCKAGNLSEAMNLQSEMEQCGILPDHYTYSILIKGLCGLRRVVEADELFNNMTEKGVLANSVAYNSLIDGYCKEGNVEKALEVCSQMTEKERNMEAAMGLYSEMIIKSLVPDVVAYTALIDGHSKKGNMKEAFRLHREMLEAGLSPNVFTVNCLIDGLCKDGKISDAIKLFLKVTKAAPTGDKINRMVTDSFFPNHVLYTTIIHGLLGDGRIFKATKFFSDMRCYGLRPDIFTYVIMLHGHRQFKHVLDVMMLHADMLKMGFIPNAVIYNVLAKCYQENEDLKSAQKCAEDLCDAALRCFELGGRMPGSFLVRGRSRHD